MATIRKRGNKYHAQIRKKSHQGITKSFVCKTDAAVWAKKIESEIEQGIFLDHSEAQTLTLSQLIKRHEEVILPSKRSQQSIKSLTGILNKAIGFHCLSSITPAVLSAHRDKRLKSVGSETVRKDLSFLQRLFNTAIKDWGINMPHGNPVEKVRFPSPPAGRNRKSKNDTCHGLETYDNCPE